MRNQTPFGWTAQARSAFLASLAACGTVRAAAQSVNLSPQAAYKLRARDPAFARAWDAAIGIARDHLVAHLTTVAFEGWTEEVWYKGELVGERHRHNPMVAMRLLERLDRMAEQQAQPIERFDTMLRAESNGYPVRDPHVRSEVELQEQIEAADDHIRLYRARELRRHLDVIHTTAAPWLCDHDDCDACRDAEEAYSLDPTAEIATEVDGAVIGCIHHDDLPDRDVRAGSVWDGRRTEVEGDNDDTQPKLVKRLGTGFDKLSLSARQNTAPSSAQPELVEGQGPASTNSASPRHLPRLECQPVSTTNPQPNEKAAPPCGDAAHSVQPDGVAD